MMKKNPQKMENERNVTIGVSSPLQSERNLGSFNAKKIVLL